MAPHVSVVAVSRNDDHGGNMLGRMQQFVNGFIAQCRKHGLRGEPILIEWNPPHGRLPLEQAREKMRGLDILVHFSHWDGLPNAVLEAMAFGLPVVASDIPACHRRAAGFRFADPAETTADRSCTVASGPLAW